MKLWSKKSLAERRGHCFACAAEYVLQEDNEALVCHGFCVTTGGKTLGKKYVHAWVETFDGNIVYDTVFQIAMPLKEYYKLGTVSDVTRYTYEQVCEQIRKIEHYGPWEHPYTADGFTIKK